MRVGREAPSRALFLQWCPCIRLGTTEGTRARLVNIPVATAYWSGYRSHVAANSATGRRNPSKQKAHSAPCRLQALFLRPQSCFMAAVRGQTSVWPGPFCPGIPTPRIAATQSRRKDRGSSTAKGATPMHAFIPSRFRAFAHRKLALCALRANSSLSARLKRYNHHMDQARALEAQGGEQ